MRAARLTSLDGPSALQLAEVADPAPGHGQILVRVKATALNRADLLQTLGLYPAPPGVPADIPGMEYAGVVEALGPGADRFQPGDRVMGLIAGGAFAERIITGEQEALPIPERLSFAEAAAVPEAFLTAFDALVLQGGLRAGHQALIHAAGSGVGTAAVQLVSHLGGTAIGTSRTAAKLDRARALGLAHAVALEGAWEARVLELTGGAGVDLVLDLIGGEHFPGTLACCASQATVMLVGLTAGPSAEVPLRTVLLKRLRIQGTTLRARSLEEKIALSEAFERALLPAFASGALKPVIGATRPFADIAAALVELSENRTWGKTVLTLDP